MTREELLYLPLIEYFKYFEKHLKKNIDLKQLTNLFTEVPYKENKPYLTRRLLKPMDKRFTNIEIIYYDDTNKVGAIVWNFNFILKEVIGIFGKPTILYEPYSNSIQFVFISKNPDIDVIKTRCPNLLIDNKIIELHKLELATLVDIDNQIQDLDVTFIQINLKD
jgi:hypothetical protein